MGKHVECILYHINFNFSIYSISQDIKLANVLVFVFFDGFQNLIFKV